MAPAGVISDFRVERVHDPVLLASFLDPARDAYMAGDLYEPYWSDTAFYGAFMGDRLVAVVDRFDRIAPPPLISAGDPAAVAAIYAHLADPASGSPPHIFYHAQDEHLDGLRAHFTIDPAAQMHMWRMTCTAAGLVMPRPLEPSQARLVRLTDADLPAAHHTLPVPGQLQPEWVFYAIIADGTYAAMAGTHIVSPKNGLGVIGWVYTHPTYRGRGFAAACTYAVSAALFGQGLRLLALNVRQDNPPAIHAYQRCGFTVYGGLWEGEATALRRG
jgi:ribosomal protein S18 acetylase RimI-like enzyme